MTSASFSFCRVIHSNSQLSPDSHSFLTVGTQSAIECIVRLLHSHFTQGLFPTRAVFTIRGTMVTRDVRQRCRRGFNSGLANSARRMHPVHVPVKGSVPVVRGGCAGDRCEEHFGVRSIGVPAGDDREMADARAESPKGRSARQPR